MGRRLAVVVAAIGLVGSIACGGSGSGSSPSGSASPGSMTDLRITATGLDQLPFMAILQVAVDKGWFKDGGLNVTISSGGGGGNTIRAVTTGDADMTIGGNTASVLAAQKEPNLKIIGPWFQSDDFYWIGTQAISSPSELSGKTLGFSGAGSTTELLVKVVANKAAPGIKTTPVGAMGNNWAAAKSGRIFAGWAMHPFVNERQAEGGKVVVSAADYVPDFVADLVMVNTDYAKQHPEAVKSFWKVVTKADAYVVNNTHEAAADLAKVMKDEPAAVEAGLKATPKFKSAYSVKVDAAALKSISDLMVSQGQISKPIDWKAFMDQQYLPKEDRANF